MDSSGGGFSSVIDSVDSPWGVVALVLILSYGLLWKFGSEILKALRENKGSTEEIKKSIVTNHGSENLGQSVDWLHNRLERMEQSSAGDRAMMFTLARDVERHIHECREYHSPGKFIEKEPDHAVGQ